MTVHDGCRRTDEGTYILLNEMDRHVVEFTTKIVCLSSTRVACEHQVEAVFPPQIHRHRQQIRIRNPNPHNNSIHRNRSRYHNWRWNP
jgi:hypothetical protein